MFFNFYLLLYSKKNGNAIKPFPEVEVLELNNRIKSYTGTSMGKSIFATILLCLLGITVNAQSNFRISGTVYDNSNKEPIGQAGIRILSASDSTYVSGTSTLDNGRFSASVKPGKYIVNVTFLGYKQVFINADASKKTVALGDIMLKDDGILLGEAVVTAKAAEIAIKGDTVEYNADSYKVQQSAVVEDLLKKMPGAEVDSEGKITINGKEITKILVDGKEFFSSDPKMASKNLPASMVDKLQVLDRKSDMAQMTGFDDGEEETVINLTVKKGMKQGLFGNASAGMGNKDRYGASGIVNYMLNDNQFTVIGGSNNTNNEGFSDNVGGSFRGLRQGGLSFGGNNGITKSATGGFNFAITSSDKMKWGGNIRYGNTNNDANSSQHSETYMSDSIKAIRGNRFSESSGWGSNKSNNFSTDLRFEWTPDSVTKIIFTPNIQFGNNRSDVYTDARTWDALDTLNVSNSSYFNDGTSRSASARLQVSRELGKKGRVLSVSLTGGFNDLDSDGAEWSKTIYPSKNDSVAIIDRKTDLKNKGHNWRGYISYVEPIGRNNFIQLNYSYRKNYSESDKKGLNLDDNDQYTIIDTTATKKLENNFVNQEIGLNFKAVRPKYNYTIGVALQPSSSKSWTITPTDKSYVANNVLNFSPVAQFNYLWSKRHNLRLDYDGSTTQPSTTQLSNVRDESDPLSITYGNPDLKPSFSNRFRIRFQNFNPEKSSALMMFGGFTISSNDIVQKSFNLENGTKETTYDNINGNWNAQLRVIYNTPLKNKKFSVNSMSFGAFTNDNGYSDGVKNTAKTVRFSESLGLRFRTDMLSHLTDNGSLEVGLRGNVNYQNTQNSLTGQQDREIISYGGTFNTNAYLPYGISIDTDLTYSANNSTGSTYKLNEWMWNASVSKDFGINIKKKSYGTGTLKLNFYDILQQRTNISQTANTRGYTETITSTLPAYFMASFIYKFQIFKGGAKMSDMDRGDFPPGGPGGRPGGGFRGRPPGM